jgi:hypothetical protein
MAPPEITETIKKMLPENYSSDDWEPIAPEDIQIGDYITYIAKPRKYNSGTETEGGWKKGGFISAIPVEEQQLRRKGNKDKIFFFRNYNKKWTVNQDNIVMFFKTKKDVEELLKKGRKKALETKEINHERAVEYDNEKMKKELKEVKKEEKDVKEPDRKKRRVMKKET